MKGSPNLWTSEEAAEATGGKATTFWKANGVSIDSRTTQTGELFIALKGPNFDGHNFVPEALKAGASAAIVNTNLKDVLKGAPGLIVKDTLRALENLASAGRLRSSAKITAITGSVGKTGTKEALCHVLAAEGDVCFSRRNLNNHWGLPLSLARLSKAADFGVFEIGMNHPGEITPLTSLAKPDIAIITKIAGAHLEFFNSLEEVARAKAEIFRGLKNGIAIINYDTEYYDLLFKEALNTGAQKILSFGKNIGADISVIKSSSGLQGSTVEALWRGQVIKYQIAQPGTHWIENSLAVLLAANALGIEIEQAAGELSTIAPLRGRGDVHSVPWGEKSIIVIDESYNANPASMEAALKTLGGIKPEGGRRIAILGDMLELGDFSAGAHANLKHQIEQYNIDIVFLAGREMAALASDLPRSRIGKYTENSEKLLPAILSSLRSGDVITIKASNGIGFSRIVDAIIKPQFLTNTSKGE